MIGAIQFHAYFSAIHQIKQNVIAASSQSSVDPSKFKLISLFAVEKTYNHTITTVMMVSCRRKHLYESCSSYQY